MEVENIWDTPEYIIGYISALKLLKYIDRQTAEQITKWGFQIGLMSVNKYWNSF